MKYSYLSNNKTQISGKRLVCIFVTKSGPPVTMPIGWLLPKERVSLDKGIEVEGIYWEGLDRYL